MDNNQTPNTANPQPTMPADPTQQGNPAGIPPAPQASQPQTSPISSSGIAQPGDEAKGSNKMLWVVVGVLVILLLAGIGYYLYTVNMEAQKKEELQKQTQTQAQQEVQALDSLNTELQGLDTEPVDTEFVSVDKDLQGL